MQLTRSPWGQLHSAIPFFDSWPQRVLVLNQAGGSIQTVPFVVTHPITMNHPLPLASSGPQAVETSLSGVYAIVDDDDALCAALSLWLQISGVRSERFESSEHLLKHYGCLRGSSVLTMNTLSPIDVPLLGAVIDINLPGMNGVVLAQTLRQRDSTLPLVLITALATQDRSLYGSPPMGVQCLKKPFEGNELMDALCPSCQR